MLIENKLSKIAGWLLSKPKVIGTFVFCFLLLMIALITNQRYKINKENEHREMINMLDVVKQNIEQSLKNSHTAAFSLALTIDDNGIPRDFNEVCAQLIDSNSNFKALQLVPNGIIKYIYPIKGNTGAIGHNIFNGSKQNVLRAYESIKSHKIYFLGPDRLLQGGVGIVGRLPVYIDKKFWGFSAVVINIDAFLRDVGISNHKYNKFYFQFSKFNVATNKEEFFLKGDTDFSGHEFESVNFPEGNWKLYLVSKNKYDVFYQVLYPMILGFILAIFCSFLITELLKKPAQLQVMVNEAKKELIQSFEMVNEQNKRLLNFSYIVSHNLRSHTSNIQAIGALIEHAETDDERKELLQLLMNVSGLLNDTLLNLNNVVNIQTSIDVIREPLLLKTYIDKTVEVLSDQVSSTGARIINLVPNSIVVDFNPAYLESILLNFIFNAIRYRSIERNPIIELSVLSESEKIILKIKDNGIGIDLSKNGDQLFGMYKTFTENPDSKGIGLFISKNQIDAMGGSVTVESVVDEGTTFTIYFKQQPRVF